MREVKQPEVIHKVAPSESIDSILNNTQTPTPPPSNPQKALHVASETCNAMLEQAPEDTPTTNSPRLTNKEKLEKLRAKSKALDTMIKKFNLELTR